MKIAVTSSDGQELDTHLGKASSIYVYQYEDDKLSFLEHRQLDIEEDGKHQGSKVLDTCKDCQVIITVKYGFKTRVKATQLGIRLVMDEGSVEDVLNRYIEHYNFMK